MPFLLNVLIAQLRSIQGLEEQGHVPTHKQAHTELLPDIVKKQKQGTKYNQVNYQYPKYIKTTIHTKSQ